MKRVLGVPARSEAFGVPSVSAGREAVYFTKSVRWSRGEDSGTDTFVMRVPIEGGEAQVIAEGARPEVSPDGRYLAYIGRPTDPECAKRPLIIRDLETGEERVWPWDGQGGEGAPDCHGIQGMDWSPDSKLLAFEVLKGRESADVRLLDPAVDRGAYTVARLLTEDGNSWHSPAFVGNNELLFAEPWFDPAEPEHHSRLMRYHLTTGSKTLVRDFGDTPIRSIEADASGDHVALVLYHGHQRTSAIVLTESGDHLLGDDVEQLAW